MQNVSCLSTSSTPITLKPPACLRGKLLDLPDCLVYFKIVIFRQLHGNICVG